MMGPTWTWLPIRGQVRRWTRGRRVGRGRRGSWHGLLSLPFFDFILFYFSLVLALRYLIFSLPYASFLFLSLFFSGFHSSPDPVLLWIRHFPISDVFDIRSFRYSVFFFLDITLFPISLAIFEIRFFPKIRFLRYHSFRHSAIPKIGFLFTSVPLRYSILSIFGSPIIFEIIIIPIFDSLDIRSFPSLGFSNTIIFNISIFPTLDPFYIASLPTSGYSRFRFFLISPFFGYLFFSDIRFFTSDILLFLIYCDISLYCMVVDN